jgi:hypothetical protein
VPPDASTPWRNGIFVFGGKNDKGVVLSDTWYFNSSSTQWQELDAGSPGKRFSCLGGFDEKHNRFVVAMGEADKKTFFNDVWALDLSINNPQWSKLTTTGTPPLPRYGMAGGIAPGGEKLWVTHGFQLYPKVERFDDTFALDLTSLVWVKVSPAGEGATKPHARCLLAGAVVEEGTMAIFGGCGSGGWGPCPAADSWTFRSDVATDGLTPSIAQPGLWTQNSLCPVARNFVGGPHGMAPLSTKQVVMYGGGRGGALHAGPGGGVSVLDIGTGQWEHAMPAAADTDIRPPIVSGALHLLHMASERVAASPSNATVYFLGSTSGVVEVWKLHADFATTTSSSSSSSSSGGCSVQSWNPRLLHGTLMMLAWGFFAPVGVTIARYYKHWGPKWFYYHQVCMVSTVALTLPGFITALLMVAVPLFNTPHAAIGAFVSILAIQQPVNGFLRPHLPAAGGDKSSKRRAWEYWHKTCGRIALLLGMLNPFWGLAYLEGGKGIAITLYSIWFASIVSFWATKEIALNRQPLIAREKIAGGRDAVVADPSDPDEIDTEGSVGDNI